jgi:small-conductance mechanosensitive channel
MFAIDGEATQAVSFSSTGRHQIKELPLSEQRKTRNLKEREMMNPMNFVFMGNSLIDWSTAVGIMVIVAMTLFVAKKVLVRRLSKLAQNTKTQLDDVLVGVLSSTRFLFILIVAAYVSSNFLELKPAKEIALFHVVVIALLIQVAVWGDKAIRLGLKQYLQKTRAEDVASTTSTAALGFVSRVTLWIVITLMILDNLGFNIATLIASLGIGGIAVALALQNILGDLFASLSIVLDKPFSVGDFIVVDDVVGTVEFVGLKTTRLRSLSGEQIVFSNADLLKSRIRNYKHMEERRIVFAIGVVYQTTQEQLTKIPKIMQEVVEAQPDTRFDRAHFKTFADSSLDFEVVFYMAKPDYNLFMDTQQAINLELFRRFGEEKIDFAYPSRTVFLVNPPTTEKVAEVAAEVTTS